MMRKRILSAVLAGVLAMGLFGCGSSSGQESSQTSAAREPRKNEATAYVGTGIFENSLDPVKGGMSHGFPFINNALLRVNPDSQYEGDLAEDWSISEDRLTYTFRLREGVTFSDGSPFTAEDVVFTYEQVKNNPAINENVDLSRLESVKADGDFQVVFTLKEAYSPFFDTTATLGIVPSDSYDSQTFDTMPIGTGAWKVAQYDMNQQIILERNDTCFDGPANLDRVTLVYMDPDAAFAAARSGQLDVVMVGTGYTGETIPGMSLIPFETMDVRNISLAMQPEHTVKHPDGRELPVGSKVMSDPAVRKALSIGIQRQEIIDHALNGIGKPASHFTDNLIWASTEDIPDGMVEEAKALLDQAGWVDSDGDGIREKDGIRCSYDVYAGGGDMDRYQLAAALAESAKPLGIEINAKNASWDEILDLEYSAGVVWGWGQYSPTVLRSLFDSRMIMAGAFDNVVFYDRPEVNVLIDQALAAGSPEEAVENWKRVQTLADQDYAYLFLVNIQHCYFVNDNLDLSLDTQIPHPHGHGSPVICNMKDWKWK